jgi:hypothetical protein
VNGSVRAKVTITPRALWRIRLARNLPRYLIGMASLMGLAASARFAISPPRAVRREVPSLSASLPDRAAEGYAVLFARRYLSWNAAEPQTSTQALETVASEGMNADAGLGLPPAGEQQVEWAEVVQAREPLPGEHVYTVAAQTDSAGLLYLSVGVTRAPGGGLAVAGYPAFVGAPAADGDHALPRLREVEEPALDTVVERALRNYLGDADGELASDLSPGARVSLPAMALTLEAVQRVDWSADGSSVIAVVQADDGRGVQYVLAYEIDVTREQGRWEVAAVQMNPDS